MVVLLASLIALSAFRERYLQVWIAGWVALIGSRLVAAHGAALHIPGVYVPAVEQAAFVLAVGLLAGAVLSFARASNLFTPLAAITLTVMAFAYRQSALVAGFTAPARRP